MAGPQQPDSNGPPALRQLYFYLTEGCNLACRHCWLAPGLETEDLRRPTLTVEHFETAIREARPLGLAGVKLTGGEPLMHPEIMRLLEIVRSEELQLNMETNGLLCTPEIAAAIAKAPTRFVSVSIDGADATTHEWVRGVPGCFERTCEGVRNLAAADTPPQIIFSVMRHNAHQVDAIVGLAEELGATSVKYNIVQPTARGEKLHQTQETLTVDELINLGRRVDTELAPKTDITLFFDYPMAFRPMSRMASNNGCAVCGILGILGVIASGHYALCGIGEHLPGMVFGTVGRDPLDTVWATNEVLNALRDGLPDRLGGICHECLVRYRCRGSCVAQNYYRSGEVFAPFWFCEEAAWLGRFPASRRATVAGDQEANS